MDYTTTLIRRKDKLFTLKQGVILFLLFLGAMEFMGKYYYLFCFAFVLFMLFYQRIRLDGSAVALICLAISTVLFSRLGFSITLILKPFLYPFSYIVGRSFFKSFHSFQERDKRQNQIVMIAAIMSLGALIHYGLNFLIYDGGQRNTTDIWTGTMRAATGQTALACLALGVSIAWIMSATKNWQKIVACLSLVLIFAYNLILAGRTLIGMAIIIFCCAYLYLIKGSKDFGRKFRFFITILFLVSVALVLFEANAFNIKSQLINSNLYERFFGDKGMDATEDNRLETKMAYLKNMWRSLWGGNKIRTEIVNNYAHDIYLDTYDQASIFGFMSILFFMWRSLRRLVYLLRNKSLDFKFRQLIFCLYLACNMEFVVEPVLQGMHWLFITYCFIDGLLACYMKDSKAFILSTRKLYEDSAN